MTETSISHRELRLAETVSRQLSTALVRRKLNPAFSGFYLTRLAGVYFQPRSVVRPHSG